MRRNEIMREHENAAFEYVIRYDDDSGLPCRLILDPAERKL
jgi:hypothetical protein